MSPERVRRASLAMKTPRQLLQTALGVTSATVLFLMMLLTALDVVGRYVFNRPLNGAFEVTEMMLAALIYCGLPLVSQQRGHIVIDTFDTFMSRRVKRALDMFAEVVCSLTLGGIGYLIFRRAVRVAEYGDTTSVLKLPLAPVAYLMGTMIIIACVIHLSLIFVPHRADDGKSIV
jgi:TRAP-type C4-dicarboxylate transport system permease small subunit